MRWREVAIALGAGAGVMLLAGMGALLWLRTDGGNLWIERQLEDALVGLAPKGRITIEGLSTDLWGNHALRRATLYDAEGRALVAAEGLTLALSPLALLSGTLALPRADLDALDVHARADAEGNLDLMAVLGLDGPSSGEPWEGLPVDLDLPAIAVRRLHLRLDDPSGTRVELGGAQLFAGVRAKGRTLEVRGIRGAGALQEPLREPFSIGGDLAYEGDRAVLAATLGLAASHAALRAVALGLEAEPTLALDLALERLELAPLGALGGTPMRGAVTGALSVRGPLDAPVASLALRGTQGARGGVAATALLAPSARWALALGAGDLQLNDYMDTSSIYINAQAVSAGAGLQWPEALSARAGLAGVVDAGEPVEGILALSLENGLLRALPPTQLRAALADAEITGSLHLIEGAVDLLARGQLHLPEPLAGTGDLDSRLRGDLYALDLHSVGSVEFPSMRAAEAALEGVAARWEARYRPGWVEARAEGSASSVRAGNAEIEGVLLESLSAEGDPEGTLQFGGVATLRAVRAGELAELAGLRLALTATSQGGGISTAAATVDSEDFAVMGWPGTGGRVEGSFSGGRATLSAALRDRERAWLDLDGTTDLSDGSAEIARLVFSPTPRQRWEVAPTALGWSAQGLRDLDLHFDGGGLGKASLQGALAWEGPLGAKLRAEGLALDALAELFPNSAGDLAGTLDLDLTLGGSASAPQLDLTVDGRQLFIPGVGRWAALAGAVHTRNSTLEGDLTLAVAGAPLARLWGSAPLALEGGGFRWAPEGPIDLHLAVLPGDLQRFSRLSPTPLALPNGKLSAKVDLSGKGADPEVQIAAVGEAAVAGWSEPARLELRGSRLGEQIQWSAELRKGFSGFARSSGTGRTQLSQVMGWALAGSAEPNWEDPALFLGPLFGSVTLEDADLQDLLALGGTAADVDGRLNATALLSGSALRPQLALGLNMEALRVGRHEARTATLRLTPADGRATVAGSLAFAEGNLALEGSVPLRIDLAEEARAWADGPLDLRLSGEGLPLGLISAFTPEIRDAEGLLKLQGEVSGTFAQPAPSLRLTTRDAAFQLPSAGLSVEHLALDLRSEGPRIELHELRALTTPLHPAQSSLRQISGKRDSSVFLQGDALLDGYAPTEVHLNASADEAWVFATEDFQTILSGEATLRGPLDDLEIRGDIGIEQAIIDMDSTAFLESAPLEIDPRLSIRRGMSPRVAIRDIVEETPSNLDLKLNVGLGRATQLHVAMPFFEDMGSGGAALTTVDTTARLGGTLEAGWSGGALGLQGVVDLLEGTARVALARFAIERGTVSFAGADPFNPFLDLDANMPVSGGGEVAMKVTGTPESPSVSFSSKKYPDPSQIMLILLTGSPPEDLTAASAMGGLVEMLGRSALGGASLGQVSYQPDGSMQFGLPIHADLGVEARWKPQPRLEENRFSVQAEYQLGPGVLISGAWGTRKSWIDLYIERRWGSK